MKTLDTAFSGLVAEIANYPTSVLAKVPDVEPEEFDKLRNKRSWQPTKAVRPTMKNAAADRAFAAEAQALDLRQGREVLVRRSKGDSRVFSRS